MKECKCNECEGYEEGYCVIDVLYPGFNPNNCNAKSNADLVTEEEYVESIELEVKVKGGGSCKTHTGPHGGKFTMWLTYN